MMGISVVNLTPQTNLGPQDIFFVLIALNTPCNVLVVEIKPGCIASIANTKIVSYTHIKIERAIVGNNNWIISTGIPSTPPVNNVSFLDINLGIHPVHR